MSGFLALCTYYIALAFPCSRIRPKEPKYSCADPHPPFGSGSLCCVRLPIFRLLLLEGFGGSINCRNGRRRALEWRSGWNGWNGRMEQRQLYLHAWRKNCKRSTQHHHHNWLKFCALSLFLLREESQLTLPARPTPSYLNAFLTGQKYPFGYFSLLLFFWCSLSFSLSLCLRVITLTLQYFIMQRNGKIILPIQHCIFLTRKEKIIADCLARTILDPFFLEK